MNNSFDNIQSDELTNEQGQFEEALQELNEDCPYGEDCPYCGTFPENEDSDQMCDGYAGDVDGLIAIESADDIIERIAHVLSEADGEFIEKIANQVLARNVKYQGDSLFRISTKNNSTL